MKKTRVAANNCPNCSTLLDAANHLFKDMSPAPGHFTVCVECGEMLRWDEAMKLERVREGWEEHLSDENVAFMLTLHHTLRAGWHRGWAKGQ